MLAARSRDTTAIRHATDYYGVYSNCVPVLCRSVEEVTRIDPLLNNRILAILVRTSPLILMVKHPLSRQSLLGQEGRTIDKSRIAATGEGKAHVRSTIIFVLDEPSDSVPRLLTVAVTYSISKF